MTARRPGAEAAVAELRREFAEGLAGRVATLRAALAALAALDAGATPEQLAAFYLPAHALAGTAAAYGADEVAAHAARLSALGAAWRRAGAAPAAEAAAAARELDGLAGAAQRYRARVAGGAA